MQLVPKKISQKRFDEAKSISKKLIKSGLLLSIGLSQILLAIILIIFELDSKYIILTMITFVTMDAYVFLNRLNIAWLKIKNYSIFTYLRIVAIYASAITLYLAMRRVIAIFYGWIVGNLVALTTLYIVSKKSTLKEVFKSGGGGGFSLKYMLSYGLPMYIVSIISTLNFWIDRFLSAIILASEIFAVYFVMSRIVAIAENFIMVMRTGLVAILSYYTKGGEVERRYRIHTTVLNITILIAAGTLTTLAIYGDVIIKILLGEKYLTGIPILQILLIALIIKVANGTLLSLPQAIKEIKEIPIIHATGLITKTILILLLYKMGPIYVAGATLVGESAAITTNLIIYNKIKQIYRIRKSTIAKITISLTPIGFTAIFKTPNIIENIALATISIILYIITTATIRTLTKEDLRYLKYAKNKLINKFLKIYIYLGRYKSKQKSVKNS